MRRRKICESQLSRLTPSKTHPTHSLLGYIQFCVSWIKEKRLMQFDFIIHAYQNKLYHRKD